MNEWISTKDRLPEKSQGVLITVYESEWVSEDGKRYPESLKVFAGRFDIPKKSGKRYWSWEEDGLGYGLDCEDDWDEDMQMTTKITAWMPFPKPYKEED